jgi:hypothetical protein
LRQEAGHRLKGAFLSPVRVSLAEEFQVLVLGDLLVGTFLPCRAERIARRTAQFDDRRRILGRIVGDDFDEIAA